MYTICNEQNITLAEAWDGVDLKLTFRRNFSTALMEQWFHMMEVVRSVVFTEENDALIWQLENKGKYSTSSLYHVINFRGVQPIYPLVVWALKIPPNHY